MRTGEITRTSNLLVWWCCRCANCSCCGMIRSTFDSPTKLEVETTPRHKSVSYPVDKSTVEALRCTCSGVFMNPTWSASAARPPPGQTLLHTQPQTLGTAEGEKPSWLLPAGNALVNTSVFSGSCSRSLSLPKPRTQQSFFSQRSAVYVPKNLIDKGVHDEKEAVLPSHPNS